MQATQRPSPGLSVPVAEAVQGPAWSVSVRHVAGSRAVDTGVSVYPGQECRLHGEVCLGAGLV